MTTATELYGRCFQRMVDVSSGKAGLEIEQRLMGMFGVESLAEAYHAVRNIFSSREESQLKMLANTIGA